MTIMINETEACNAFEVSLDEDGDLDMLWNGRGITLDHGQALQFLPILQKFIDTGSID